ncbi:MAG: hypothetical protein KAV00_09035, partial [Phycisphaerae bacterium]|nr:hypothetical protein [Phycisphaerae bacterium]
CGTNCQNYCVYDIDGKELLEGNASGLDVSPSGRFLMICPSLPLAGRGLELIDLTNLTTIYKSNIKPSEAWVSEVRWISETKIDAEYVQKNSQKFHRRIYIESTKFVATVFPSTPFQTGL